MDSRVGNRNLIAWCNVGLAPLNHLCEAAYDFLLFFPLCFIINELSFDLVIFFLFASTGYQHLYFI